MCGARNKNPLHTPTAMFGRCFIWTFVIAGLRYTAKSQEWFKLFLIVMSKKFSSLWLFSYPVAYFTCGSWLLRTFKNTVALFLLPNRAWELSKYRQNVFGAISDDKVNSIAFFSRFYEQLSDRITIIERPIGPELSEFQIKLSQRK